MKQLKSQEEQAYLQVPFLGIAPRQDVVKYFQRWIRKELLLKDVCISQSGSRR